MVTETIYKTAKVIILPTEGESILFKEYDLGGAFKAYIKSDKGDKPSSQYFKAHHMYIISDEHELEDGDLAFNSTDNTIVRVISANTKLMDSYVAVLEGGYPLGKQYLTKLIATTDVSLVGDVLKIPDHLVSDYVRLNGFVREVVIGDSDGDSEFGWIGNTHTNIQDNSIKIFEIKNSKMFSYDDVYRLLYEAYNKGIEQGNNPTTDSFEDWVQDKLI
jgi:hypothetical protein